MKKEITTEKAQDYDVLAALKLALEDAEQEAAMVFNNNAKHYAERVKIYKAAISKNESGPSVKVSDDRISDILCSAFEGGTGYWLRINRYKLPKNKPALTDPYWPAKHTWVPLSEDGIMFVGEDEEGDGSCSKEHELTREKLLRGLALMEKNYYEHFSNIITENDDAVTGDVLIQCALLGEIVYG